MPVDSMHECTKALQASWVKIRDCVSGPRVIKEKTTAYLPRLKSQERRADLYTGYLMRALFVPVAARTKRAFVGLVFRKNPQVLMPASAEPVLEDITLSGMPFEVFARQVFSEAIAPGRVGVLVDMSPTASATAPRAFQRCYTAETILDWRETTVGQMREQFAGIDSPEFAALGLGDASKVLTHIRLKEYPEEPNPDDPFTVIKVCQIRVIELVDMPGADGGTTIGMRHQLWREEVGSYNKRMKDRWRPYGPPYVPLRRGAPLPFIPFEVINPTMLGTEPEDPPMLGLCEINLSQYRTSADLENARWKMGHPQLAGFGFTKDDELEIGAAIWTCENPQGHVDVIQIADQFGGLERAMAEKDEQMIAEGARLMAKPEGPAETATAARLKRSGERSLLATVADTTSNGLERALTYHVWWDAGTGDLADFRDQVSVTLNTDFDDQVLTGADAEAWLRVQLGGGISKDTLLRLYEWNDVFPEGRTVEQEKALIEMDQASALENLPPLGNGADTTAPPVQ